MPTLQATLRDVGVGRLLTWLGSGLDIRASLRGRTAHSGRAQRREEPQDLHRADVPASVRSVSCAPRWPLAAALLCAVACSGNGQALQVDRPGVPDAADTGSHVRFDPGQGAPMAFGAVPWPDDLYFTKSQLTLGDLPDSTPNSEYTRALRTSLAELDGFGIATPIYFFVEGDIDPATLPQSPEESVGERASVFLLDADTGSPDAFKPVGVELQWSAELGRLALRPALGHPLTPGRRYAALVTRRVRDTGGRPLAPAPKFAAVRDSTVVLSDARLQQARAAYTPVLETLVKAGTPREDVVAMAVFRVQTVNADLESARRMVRARPLPQPANLVAIDTSGLDRAFGKVGESQTAAAHDQLLGVIHGTLSSPNFVSATANTHGAWTRDNTQSLQRKRDEEVPFTLFVPKGEQPAPIVIYQHQRGHERSDGVFLANALARRNIAVIAIDAPFQGLRARPESSRGVDSRNRFTASGMPDGFGDEPGDFYGERDEQGSLVPLHPVYARDALRQGVVDLMNLLRFLEAGDFKAWANLGSVGQRKLDVRRFGFVGEDIGSEMGVLLAPFEPTLSAMALVGASAFVTQGFWLGAAQQPLFSALASRLGRSAEDIDYQGDSPAFWPQLALFETLLGRGEPLAYASALRRAPANVLLIMARNDETTANLATEALSVSLGAPVLAGEAHYARDLESRAASSGETIAGNFPIADDRVTRFLSVYDPADHDLLLSERGTRTYESPVEPPFRRLDAAELFENPHSAVLEHLTEYFASFFACVTTGTHASSDIQCTAAVTAP